MGMIAGTGIDIIEIDRIKKAHQRFGARFLKRLYSADEQKYCLRKKDPYASLAGRFAAKEAIIKAFSHGFGGRWKWIDIEVTREDSGKPGIRLHRRMEELRKERNIHTILLSIAHNRHDAVATIVMESAEE